MRGSTLDALRRAYLSLTRGRIESVNDSKPVQTIAARLMANELHEKIERLTTYAFTSVPLPPDKGTPKGAEAVVAFMHGNRSHPVSIGDIDRRTRPKNLKPGESAHHDDQKQIMLIARDGYRATAKDHVFTAGDKPDTSAFELNEQLKGLAARMAQAEHNLHGLFDVTSRFRQIVQQDIPAVAEVAPILNQLPSGLPAMADAISGKEQSYLQKQVEQALQKFLSPNLASLSSLLSNNLESSIANLKSQIADLITQNPVVATVDALKDEFAALTTSGAEASVISEGSAALQAQITALTTQNPIVGTVAGLRNTLQGMIDQGGPGLNFLAPQKRLVQGLSKSLHLAKAS